MVRVTPAPHRGKKQLCPIVFQTVFNSSISFVFLLILLQGPQSQIYFEYQKRKFIYNPDTKQFVKVGFPVGLPISNYLASQGLQEDSIVCI